MIDMCTSIKIKGKIHFRALKFGGKNKHQCENLIELSKNRIRHKCQYAATFTIIITLRNENDCGNVDRCLSEAK